MNPLLKTVIVIVLLASCVLVGRELVENALATSGDSTQGSYDTDTLVFNPHRPPVRVNHYEKYIAAYGLQKPDDLNNSPSEIIGHTPILNEIQAISKLWEGNVSDSLLYRPPSGILLHGPPGTGKTTLSRQIAKYLSSNDTANVAFLHVSSDLIENKYQGEGLKFMRGVFTLCAKIEPCVLFFDEIDGVMSKRSNMDQSNVNNLKTTFLSGFDTLREMNKRVLVIGATNRPACIDPALMRRLELHFHMDVPSVNDKCVAISRLLGGENESYIDIVTEVLPINATLHDIYSFIRFCVRRQLVSPDMELCVETLSVLYSEYKTVFKFVNVR